MFRQETGPSELQVGIDKLALSLAQEKQSLENECNLTVAKGQEMATALLAYKALLESTAASQSDVEQQVSTLETKQEETSEQVLIIKRVFGQFKLAREDTEDLENQYGDIMERGR